MDLFKLTLYSNTINSCRLLPLLLFYFSFFTILFIPQAYSLGNTEGHDFYYSKHFEDGLNIKDYLSAIPEMSGRLTFEEVRTLPDSVFFTIEDQPFLFGETLNYWIKLKITNDADVRRFDYFAVASAYDTLEVYSIKEGAINFEMLTGHNIHPKIKRIPIRRNLVNFELDPGESIEFYFRGCLMGPEQQKHLFNFYIFKDFYSSIKHIFLQNLNRIFLASILFLFALFSLVMFFTFKEKIFFIYSVLMLFLTFYFLDFQRIIDYIFFYPVIFRHFISNNIFLSGSVIFSYLFVSRFLSLKYSLPRFNSIYLLTALIAVISAILRSFVFSTEDPTGTNILNLLLLIFIVSSFIPIILLSLRGIKQAKILLFSMSFMFFGVVILLLSLLNILPFNEFTSSSFQWGVVAFSGTLFYGLFDNIKTIQREKIQFKVEKEKTDELLFNILPYEVASELKEKGFSEARDYSKVNVMFTDFKDFTATSGQLSAKELVYEVNSCFVAFDHIIEKYKIEKIKTIGDSYMAASGLETKTEVKVKGIVLAAIEMQEFLLSRKMKLLTNDQHVFEMRVGIHTGPVVAGIVGVKKFQYDIWGDTVNTASRIEAYGEVGKVNISEATYQCIKDDTDFVFERREEIEVKGKGKLNMWFVYKSNLQIETKKNSMINYV